MIFLLLVAGWTDRPCDVGKCCICENDEPPVLTLRGMCEDTVLDTFYVPYNPGHSGQMVFTGLMGTVIQYNDDQLRYFKIIIQRFRYIFFGFALGGRQESMKPTTLKRLPSLKLQEPHCLDTIPGNSTMTLRNVP